MTKKEYEAIFRDALKLDSHAVVANMSYQDVPQWDSIGHLAMIARLEAALQVQFEVDDVIDFGSFEEGWKIIQKYL